MRISTCSTRIPAYLLFFGLSEPAENIRNRGSRENTDYMVKEFMRNEMAFEGSASLDVDTIEFDRIHRLGRPKFDGNGRLLKPRPVVAAFKNFKVRECVRRTASTIKKQTVQC